MVTAQNPYCTIEEVLEELRWNAAEAPEGSAVRDRIQRAINDASRYIEAWTGRDYLVHDFTTNALVVDEFQRLTLEGKLWLPYGPKISITSVTVESTVWVEEEDYVAVDELEPVGSYRTTLHSLRENWSPKRSADRLIEIDGKFGYDQATSQNVPTGLPSLVSRATRMIGALMTGDLKKEFIGLDGAKATLIQTEVPKLAEEILGSTKQVYT